ncbi:MAG: hypothetical protein WAL97_05135 [Halobacteriota archaeon]
MTWTYSGDPKKSRLDNVRLLMGDTNENDQLLSNEEIQIFLEKTDSDLFAAANACEALVAKLILRGRKDQAEMLKESCEQLRTRANSSVGPIVV